MYLTKKIPFKNTKKYPKSYEINNAEEFMAIHKPFQI